MVRIAILLFIPFVLFAQNEKTKSDESFNPSELKEPKIEFPLIIMPDDKLLGEEEEEDIPADSTLDGYRIQILTTRDPEEADTLKAQLQGSFPGEVYVNYDPPNYKVRVGNYVNRPLAEESQARLKGMGFRRAWVIRTRVLVAPKIEER
jgi:cell division protein FtsN